MIWVNRCRYSAAIISINMQKSPEKLSTMQVSATFQLFLFISVINSKSLLRVFIWRKDETMLATLSVQKPIKGYPMVDTIKVADSTLNGTSTGNVNFYLQKNDPIFANIKKKNEVSAFFSNETTQFNNETSQFETIGNRVMIAGFVSQVSWMKNRNWI